MALNSQIRNPSAPALQVLELKASATLLAKDSVLIRLRHRFGTTVKPADSNDSSGDFTGLSISAGEIRTLPHNLLANLVSVSV